MGTSGPPSGGTSGTSAVNEIRSGPKSFSARSGGTNLTNQRCHDDDATMMQQTDNKRALDQLRRAGYCGIQETRNLLRFLCQGGEREASGFTLDLRAMVVVAFCEIRKE